mgnify:CR=1 FL=1
MTRLPAQPFAFDLAPDRAALVIIDMQRDFVEPGGFGETLGNDVSLLEAIVPACQAVLDAWRDAGGLVVHTREAHAPDLSDCPPAKRNRGNPSLRIGDAGPMGRILVAGEPGNQIIPALAPVPGEIVIDKPGKGMFWHTGLHETLQAHGITHLVFAGDRTEEFERKLQGASYMEILQAGGGILSTMRATRAASQEALTEQTRTRLHEMSRLGTTTVEIKSGYGLDTASELKILATIATLASEPCCEVFPTFLGAHAVPPTYAGRGDTYSQLVIEEMLPAVTAWHQDSALAAKPLFCDVFCEPGAFDYAQTAAILAAASRCGRGTPRGDWRRPAHRTPRASR